MTKTNTNLTEILSQPNSEHKFEALISWLIDVFDLPFEIEKDYKEKRRLKKYSRTRLLAEGSIYQPNNYTETFGPRIIFKLHVRPSKEWFFTITFQFSDVPLHFSDWHILEIPHVIKKIDVFKEFMTKGNKRLYELCIEDL